MPCDRLVQVRRDRQASHLNDALPELLESFHASRSFRIHACGGGMSTGVPVQVQSHCADSYFGSPRNYVKYLFKLTCMKISCGTEFTFRVGLMGLFRVSGRAGAAPPSAGNAFRTALRTAGAGRERGCSWG